MLTDAQIKRAKPAEKPYKLTDGQGLILFVTPAGGRIWRLRYRQDGKEKLHVIGPYPAISLADARVRRDAARANLARGLAPDAVPADTRSEAAVVPTFKAVALDWMAVNKSIWVEGHAKRIRESLESEVFPAIGEKPINGISVQEVLSVLRAVENRGAIDTAKRIRQRISGIFVHAISSGLADQDPAAVVTKALRPTPTTRRRAAVTNIDDARLILRAVDASDGHAYIKLALRLTALTALRPGTIITTPWSEIPPDDVDVWVVPPARMKLSIAAKQDANKAHHIPVTRQVRDIFNALRVITGSSPFLFPNGYSALRHASENAMSYMLKRALLSVEGVNHVPHGWRATFSTVMNERRPADRGVIDLMLAHTPKDKVEAAYNRAEHMARRMEIAQEWADLLMVDQMSAADVANLPVRQA